MVTRETYPWGSRLVSVGVPSHVADAAEDRMATLASLLGRQGLERGFLGPGERGRIEERHILDSAALLPFVRPGAMVDVGSGAGLPGLVLACLHPSLVTLVEASNRRCDFLEEVAAALDVSVRVIRERAEVAGHDLELRGAMSTAVARALAPVPVALEYCLPFVRVGGRAVLAVGPSAVSDLDVAEAAAETLGGGPPEVEELPVPGAQGARWAMIVEKRIATPERYPRRTGVPARRPLGRS